MKIYFLLKINQSYSFQNKLQEAIYNYLKEADRSLYPLEHIQDVLRIFQRDIEEICKKHPRCKAIKLDYHTNKEKGITDFMFIFQGASICHGGFYFAKSNS